MLDSLEEAGVPRVGVGKVDDLFAGENIASTHTPTNADAYALIGEALESMESGLLFANVIEFDQSWGHRNDVDGFYAGLQELDLALPRVVEQLRDGDLMVITADHGNDPTTRSTDHSREMVPILIVGPGVQPVDLGVRPTFADIGATAAEFFGVRVDSESSMLGEVVPSVIG